MLVSMFADDIKKWITSVFGVSNETFIFDVTIVILVFGVVASIAIWLLVPRIERRRKPHEKEMMSLNEARKDLLDELKFFLNQWKTHKKLLENKKLETPKNVEIQKCSDRIKAIIERVRLLNRNKTNEIIPQIEAISNDMAQFGGLIRRFPRFVTIIFDGSDGSTEIKELISRGDALSEKVELVISKVEKAFR